MSIDWFTVVAQIINFLILVWLLKRFLYQPILDAIDARELRIANELERAEAMQSEAQKQRHECQQKNAELAQQQDSLLKQARAAADNERQSLLVVARQQADRLVEKRHLALAQEQQNLKNELQRLSTDEVFAITRKVLTDLAGASLEQHIIEIFIQRIEAMGREASQSFANAVFSIKNEPSTTNDKLLVRSAFDIPAQQRTVIHTALNAKFSMDIPLQFDTSSDVIAGIELRVKGQMISWSIREYLTSLEKKVEELLQHGNEKKSLMRASKDAPATPPATHDAASLQ